MNDLLYIGAKAPSRRSAIPDVIRDEVAIIEKAGVACTPPTKPILYTKLVEELTSLGLFAATDPPPSDGQGGSNPPDTGALQGEHLAQVFISCIFSIMHLYIQVQALLLGEERNSVTNPPPGLDVGSPSDHETDVIPPPTTEPSEMPPIVFDYQAAYVALKAEHNKLSNELSRCKQELSRSNTRCLTLENTLATGNCFWFLLDCNIFFLSNLINHH